MVSKTTPKYFRRLQEPLDRLPKAVADKLAARIVEALAEAFDREDPELPSPRYDAALARLDAIGAKPDLCESIADAVCKLRRRERPRQATASPADVLAALRKCHQTFRLHTASEIAINLTGWTADALTCQRRLAGLEAIDAAIAAAPQRARQIRAVLRYNADPADLQPDAPDAPDVQPAEAAREDFAPRMNHDLAIASKVLPAASIAADPMHAAAVGRAVAAMIRLCQARPDLAENFAATVEREAARHESTNHHGFRLHRPRP
jgi:hypothetical protein